MKSMAIDIERTIVVGETFLAFTPYSSYGVGDFVQIVRAVRIGGEMVCGKPVGLGKCIGVGSDEEDSVVSRTGVSASGEIRYANAWRNYRRVEVVEVYEWTRADQEEILRRFTNDPENTWVLVDAQTKTVYGKLRHAAFKGFPEE